MKNLTFFIIGLVAFTLTSCKEEKTKNIIVLIDTSGTIDSNTIEWYKSTTENSVIKKMGMKDRLMVLPIDYGSQTASQEIFRVDFSKNNYKNEFAGLQAEEVEIQSHNDSINTEILKFNLSFEKSKSNRAKYNKGTDIIGSLNEASKYYDPNAENIIVIFSDMMQYTDESKMNMETQLNSSKDIEIYLSKVDPIYLNGYKILILTGLQDNVKPNKYNSIKSFWELYISNNGGDLIDYSGAMQSKLEESISTKSFK